MNSDEMVLKQINALKAARGIETSTVDYLRELLTSFPTDVLQRQSGMRYGRQSKYLRYEVPVETFAHNIDLLQITDVQFGHIECRVDRMIEYRDWVLAKPYRFMYWVGDMVDAWALWSPGMGWDQLFDPQSQVMNFVKLWAPARHRILGFVGGNHERRAIPGFGDLGTLLANLLGIPYSNGRQMIDVFYGAHQPFKTTLWHGAGGARTKGTVAQILDRFMQIGDSHLYLMGHVHQAMVIPSFQEVRVGKSMRVKLVKKIGAVGSSFLNTYGTYGEIAGYNGSDVMMANTRLEPQANAQGEGKWAVVLR